MEQRSVTIPGRPVPWARTAIHKGRRITAKKQREHQKVVAMLAKAVTSKMMKGPLNLQVTFVYRRPKKPKYSVPQVRPDIDNLIKQIQDALQGVWYEDDAQIVSVCASKEYGQQHATEVTVTCLD